MLWTLDGRCFDVLCQLVPYLQKKEKSESHFIRGGGNVCMINTRGLVVVWEITGIRAKVQKSTLRKTEFRKFSHFLPFLRPLEGLSSQNFSQNIQILVQISRIYDPLRDSSFDFRKFGTLSETYLLFYGFCTPLRDFREFEKGTLIARTYPTIHFA